MASHAYRPRKRLGYSGKIDRPGQDASGERIEVVCTICGVQFWPRRIDVARGGGRHCSKNCSARAFTKLKCAHCGKTFCLNDADVKRYGRRFCSEECALKWKPKRVMQCAQCGKDMRDQKRRFCSKECCDRNQRAQRAAMLVDEKTQLHLTIAAYARRTGRSVDSIRRAIRSGRLGDAWIGRRIDVGHPNAIAFENSRPHILAKKAINESQRTVAVGGENFTLQELQRISGISYGLLYKRIVKMGMDPLDAVTLPMRRYMGKYFHDGKTMSEWSALLGLTEQTIRNRMSRRKATFSEVIEDAKCALSQNDSAPSAAN